MGGKYRAYPEYRDSEVEWLEAIPATWKVSRIKFFSNLNPSKAQIRAVPSNTEITFLPMEAIGEQGSLDTSRIKLLKEVLEGYTYIGEGDVCIAKITPCFENGKGAVVVGLKNSIAFATTEVIPLRCARLEDSKYLYYLLTSSPFNKEAEGSMYGAGGQKRVADNFVANYHFASPSFSERQEIANFLDHETAKIDTLIEKQQQLIKLLKEKRQAVVSHAVTKGLNPDAPMRDSGVEWLGEVPAHWEVLKVQRVLESIEQGSSPVASNKPPEHFEAGVIKISAVNSGVFHKDRAKTLDEEDYEERFQIHRGNLLVTRGNTPELVADACVVDVVPETRLMMSDLVYRLNTKLVMVEKYLCYWLLSSSGRLQIQNDARGSSMTMAKVSQGHIKSWLTTLPPLAEQKQIVGVLESTEGKLKTLLSNSQLVIEILQERRTALISAAVTGKIDLRNWQNPNETNTAKIDAA